MKRNEDLNETVRLLFVLIIVFTFSRDSWGPSSLAAGGKWERLSLKKSAENVVEGKVSDHNYGLKFFSEITEWRGRGSIEVMAFSTLAWQKQYFGNLKFFVQLTRQLWTVQFLRSVAFLSASSFTKWQLCREFLRNADEALQFRFAFMDY